MTEGWVSEAGPTRSLFRVLGFESVDEILEHFARGIHFTDQLEDFPYLPSHIIFVFSNLSEQNIQNVITDKDKTKIFKNCAKFLI